MSHYIDFKGALEFDKKVNERLVEEVKKIFFNNHSQIEKLDKLIKGKGFYGYNKWEIDVDNNTLIIRPYDGSFYDYLEWLKYIIDEIIKPLGFSLSGKIVCIGEGNEFISIIKVNNNIVKEKEFNQEEIGEYLSGENKKAISEIGNILLEEKIFVVKDYLLKSFKGKNFLNLKDNYYEAFFYLTDEGDDKKNIYVFEECEEYRYLLIKDNQDFDYSTIKILNIFKIVHFGTKKWIKFFGRNDVYAFYHKDERGREYKEHYIFEKKSSVNRIIEIINNEKVFLTEAEDKKGFFSKLFSWF